MLSAITGAGGWAQSAPVFRSTTETVLVPASVLDKQGQPVKGLTIENFELRVDGKPVHIAALNEIDGQAAAAAKSRALPPGVVTNLPPGENEQPSRVILLVDFMNTAQPDRMQLRKQLLKFLSTELKPGQQIAIYALSHSLNLVHPFTGDTAPLVDAAARLMRGEGLPAVPGPNPGFDAAPAAVAGFLAPSPAGPPSLTQASGGAGAGGDIENFLLESAWRATVYATRARAEDTLAQFRQLANSFAGVAGKKTVLWLTGDASPLNPTLMNMVNLSDPSSVPLRLQWREVSATYEALSAAGISLFPVDIRGAVNPGLMQADEASTHATFAGQASLAQPGARSEYTSVTSMRQGEAANGTLAMETAAAETGGQVLAGNNDLSKLLVKAQNLWSDYYVLAFSPDAGAGEKAPSYHRIEVKVPGHGGQVLYRRGYLSRPEKLVASTDESRRDVTEASMSPVDLTAIPLTLRLAPVENSEPGGDPHFTLAIPAAALGRSASAHGTHYDFSIFLVVRNAKGKVLSETGDKIDRVFAPAEAAGIAQHGFLYPGQFNAPRGEKSFARVIVRDNRSGRVGTITVQIGHD
ncbi:MAG TPA: VWA domain-containing protein [Bryobacteraceae bacterium]|nr:VWA domain-containing protein [Bryobacteraceae bacterium]